MEAIAQLTILNNPGTGQPTTAGQVESSLDQGNDSRISGKRNRLGRKDWHILSTVLRYNHPSQLTGTTHPFTAPQDAYRM